MSKKSKRRHPAPARRERGPVMPYIVGRAHYRGNVAHGAFRADLFPLRPMVAEYDEPSDMTTVTFGYDIPKE